MSDSTNHPCWGSRESAEADESPVECTSYWALIERGVVKRMDEPRIKHILRACVAQRSRMPGRLPGQTEKICEELLAALSRAIRAEEGQRVAMARFVVERNKRIAAEQDLPDCQIRGRIDSILRLLEQEEITRSKARELIDWEIHLPRGIN
jgi:hypothetical protein